MGWLKKNTDPVSARAHALNSQIAALKREINTLHSQVGSATAQPRLRSTTLPRSVFVGREAVPPMPRLVPEPIFEELNQDRLKAKAEYVAPAEHFNELGVRKYDLLGLLTRIKKQFSGPAASNTQFVNYLAAGGVQGLRPMRYEKRVARNRLIGGVIFLFVILLLVFSMIIRNR